MENDWDLSSIVCRRNVTTFTNSSTFCKTSPQNLSTTNSIISLINTTPSCFEDFIFNQEIKIAQLQQHTQWKMIGIYLLLCVNAKLPPLLIRPPFVKFHLKT
jgi:hypothetical protein